MDTVIFARHAATDMSAIDWVMIANSSNCLISPVWLASIAEGNRIINATLQLYYIVPFVYNMCARRCVQECVRVYVSVSVWTHGLLTYLS